MFHSVDMLRCETAISNNTSQSIIAFSNIRFIPRLVGRSAFLFLSFKRDLKCFKSLVDKGERIWDCANVSFTKQIKMGTKAQKGFETF